MSMSLCLSMGLDVRTRISETARPNFVKFFFCARLFISVARSFLVVLRYVMYTSGFANDVTFAYYNCQKQATLKGMYSE